MLHGDDARLFISGNQLIMCQKRQVFHFCLRQKQPIKRIIVFFERIRPGKGMYR